MLYMETDVRSHVHPNRDGPFAGRDTPRRHSSRTPLSNTEDPSAAANAARSWDALSHTQRLQQTPDHALRMMCDQIAHDYSAFFKRHVTPRLDSTARLSTMGTRTLICLGSFARAMTNAEVATVLRSAPASVARGLEQLEYKGYVLRTPCPHDGRAVCVALTEAGRISYDEMMTYWRVAVQKAELLTGLTLSESEFAACDTAFHTIKDRARAFVEYRPGRASRYLPGMSRPDHADRHSARRAYDLRDSYLRFYAEIAAQDYKTCWTKRICKPLIADVGLTAPQLEIAVCVDLYPVDLNPARLAEALRCDAAKISRATQKLVSCGIVETLSDPDDDRLVRLSLTPKGRDLTDAYRRRTRALVERVDIHFDMNTTAQQMTQLLDAAAIVQRRAMTFANLKALPEADPR